MEKSRITVPALVHMSASLSACLTWRCVELQKPAFPDGTMGYQRKRSQIRQYVRISTKLGEKNGLIAKSKAWLSRPGSPASMFCLPQSEGVDGVGVHMKR